MSSRRPSARDHDLERRPARRRCCRGAPSDSWRCRCAPRVGASRPGTRQVPIDACSGSRPAFARRRGRPAARLATRAPWPSFAVRLAGSASRRVWRVSAGSSVGCGRADTVSLLEPRLTSCSALGVSSRGVPSVASAPERIAGLGHGLVGGQGARRTQSAGCFAGAVLIAIGDEVGRIGRELLALGIEDQRDVQRRQRTAVAGRGRRERYAENDDAVHERGQE